MTKKNFLYTTLLILKLILILILLISAIPLVALGFLCHAIKEAFTAGYETFDQFTDWVTKDEEPPNESGTGQWPL